MLAIWGKMQVRWFRGPRAMKQYLERLPCVTTRAVALSGYCPKRGVRQSRKREIRGIGMLRVQKGRRIDRKIFEISGACPPPGRGAELVWDSCLCMNTILDVRWLNFVWPLSARVLAQFNSLNIPQLGERRNMILSVYIRHFATPYVQCPEPRLFSVRRHCGSDAPN